MDTPWWSVSSPGYSNPRVVVQPDLGSHPPNNVPIQLTTLSPLPLERHPHQVPNSNFSKVKSEHWNGQTGGPLPVSNAHSSAKQGHVVLPFKCAQCEFWTTSELIFKSHINEVHLTSVETQTCSSISRASQSSFCSPTKRQSKKSQKFSCLQCAYRCGQKQSLEQHVLSVHEKLKPFGCPHCDYRCSRKQNLDKHILGIHDRSKPYICDLCDTSFSQSVTLTNHIRGVHEKSKPYTCPHCEYRCAYRGNLNMHIMTIHEKVKPFSCELCSYSCTLRSALTRHKMSAHNDKSGTNDDIDNDVISIEDTNLEESQIDVRN